MPPAPPDLPPFTMVYQPVYHLHTGQLLSVEALARFTPTPYRSPDQWFNNAWDNGTGIDLELATIQAALTGANELPTHIPIAVNAAGDTLPHLGDLITTSPHPVIVELTEHRPVPHYPTTRAHVKTLRDAGALLAVDDTGANTATFQHVAELDPDIIKVDRVLTTGVATHPRKRALAHALATYANGTDAHLIIEGVDNPDDLHVWQHAGAHGVQSYLTGRPGDLPVPTHVTLPAPSAHVAT